MAARQLTSILLFASLFVTATSRQTRNRQTSPTETAAQSHLIAASIDSKHLLRDDDLAVIKNMIATTENNDPEVEESEASRIGYITDQQRSQSSCKSCSLEKKHSGNDHLRGKTLKSSVDDSRSSNKIDDGSTTSNDMRASQGSNNAKESALHKVQNRISGGLAPHRHEPQGLLLRSLQSPIRQPCPPETPQNQHHRNGGNVQLPTTDPMHGRAGNV